MSDWFDECKELSSIVFNACGYAPVSRQMASLVKAGPNNYELFVRPLIYRIDHLIDQARVERGTK